MKKILLALAMVAIFIVPAKAFKDITDSKVNLAASALESLGIVNGVGSDNFAPNKGVTRAEFSKMAVLAMGDNSASGGEFTIFPDVKNTHWAAAFINSAVKKHKILKGYANGTFGPDKGITYAESCSIVLSMLGYKIEDIGALWPQSYVNKARDLGLLDGITDFKENSPITRGDTALIVKNTLTASTKDGPILLKKSFKNVQDNAILVATSETNSELSGNSAIFYIAGNKVEPETKEILARDLIGAKGYVVSDDDGKVLGFIPSSGDARDFTVVKSYNDKIDTTSTTVRPNNNTVVIMNGSKLDFSTAWFDILPDSKITVHYGNKGNIDLIVAGLSTSNNATVFTKNSSIPTGYKVLKGGVVVDRLKEYDVISVDVQNKQIIASDNKVTGHYEKGSPSYTNPSVVRVLGKEYPILPSVAGSFKDIAIGTRVTLLLDSYGNVAGAVPASKVETNNIGILQKIEGDTATIKLLAGPIVKGKIASSMGFLTSESSRYTNAYRYYRQLVSVKSYDDNTLWIEPDHHITKKSGDLDIVAKMLGSTHITTNATIFDKSDNVLEQISISDIKSHKVPSKDIHGVILDNAGNIKTIILNDYTGLANNVGIVYGETTEGAGGSIGGVDFNNYYHTMTLKVSEDKTYSYKVINLAGVNGGSIVSLPKYLDEIPYIQDIRPIVLHSMGVAKLTDFKGSESVKINGVIYPIKKDINVYLEKAKRYVTLPEAKSNFENFRLYTNKAGVISFIVAY